jgi:ribulose-5-phosphate 4-epimerase/fuculose-1-phosphate aldolase
VDDTTLREALVAAGRRLGARGLIAGAEGNLSVRLPGNRLLVSPTGLRKDELTPDDLVVVPLEQPPDGDSPTVRGLRPSSDMAIHRAVMAVRPDVAAVVHAHLPVSMALTLAGETPDPAVLPETALLLPYVPVVPYEEMGSAKLAARIAAALTSGATHPNAVLLERHGAVAAGSAEPDGADALRQAVDRLELVDVLCRVWRDALLLRAARTSLSGSA